MKCFTLLLLLLMPVCTFAADELGSIRKCFHESLKNPAYASVFHRKVAALQNPSPVQLAYQAASFALLAKETWNPVTKLSYINKYSQLIDRAVALAPMDIEIRFLRLSIDHFTPGILGRKTNTNTDKNLIITLLSPLKSYNIDKSFNRFILYFLRTEKIYSAEQLAFISGKIQ